MPAFYCIQGGIASRRLRPKPGVPYKGTVKHDLISPDRAAPRVDAAAIDRARAELAAGVGVEHAVVSEWLKTWGKPGRKPFREWLAAWNG